MITSAQKMMMARAGVPSEPAAGESVYTSAGTYSWVCPDGVTSVSIVAVGGGVHGGVSRRRSDSSSKCVIGWRLNGFFVKPFAHEQNRACAFAHSDAVCESEGVAVVV